jgi:hypothetical protein
MYHGEGTYRVAATGKVYTANWINGKSPELDAALAAETRAREAEARLAEAREAEVRSERNSGMSFAEMFATGVSILGQAYSETMAERAAAEAEMEAHRAALAERARAEARQRERLANEQAQARLRQAGPAADRTVPSSSADRPALTVTQSAPSVAAARQQAVAQPNAPVLSATPSTGPAQTASPATQQSCKSVVISFAEQGSFQDTRAEAEAALQRAAKRSTCKGGYSTKEVACTEHKGDVDYFDPCRKTNSCNPKSKWVCSGTFTCGEPELRCTGPGRGSHQ